jgi:MinD-like ATPase involved in chromosome partitioning or flagellar assembly
MGGGRLVPGELSRVLELEDPADVVTKNKAAHPRRADGGALWFDVAGGPLLAVCGLCGGAGTSTLAYTVAAAAAKQSRAPVFACETSGIGGGLGLYARAHARLSLTQAANQLGVGNPPNGLVVSSPERVRVLASRPAVDQQADREAVTRLLGRARAEGGLVVLDCGTASQEVDRLALANASHVLWMMPATVSGIARAATALRLLAPGLAARQALVARLDRRERPAPISQLAELAGRWEVELILFPHVEDIAEALVEEAIEDAQVALEAIAGVLRR